MNCKSYLSVFGFELTLGVFKEPLNKSRLMAQHLSCLPFFRHLAQKSLDNRQAVRGLFAQPDEKIADAIQALNLISVSLMNKKNSE